MDTSIWVAIITTTGVLFTVLGSISIAGIANRKESRKAAAVAIDQTALRQLEVRDERIQLREERITMLLGQLEECRNGRTDLELEIKSLERQIDSLEKENIILRLDVRRRPENDT